MTVDYLLIESSGISEPQQVAEAFTLDFYDMLEEEEVRLETVQSTWQLTDLRVEKRRQGR